MNLVEKVTEMVALDGVTFSVDLIGKNLTVGKKTIIKDGVLVPEYADYPLEIEAVGCTGEALSYIESLYAVYRVSIPSERSESKSKRYFRALKEKDLDTDDMLYGVPRCEAQVTLETAVLCLSILGLLKWNDEEMGGTWFWQSKAFPSLIILKEWV